MSSYIQDLSSDKNATQGFFAQLTKFLVLDVIYDPTLLTRDVGNTGIKEEIEASKARVDFWKKKYGLDIPQKFYVSENVIAEIPRNTVIARPLNSPLISGIKSKSSELLLPFFPSHFAMPCKPGEVVWALRESSKPEHSQAWWVCKVVEFGTSDDVNFSYFSRNSDQNLDQKNGEKKYLSNAGKLLPDGRTNLEMSSFFVENEKWFEDVITKSESSKITVKEKVPRFKKRPGDLVLEGSNNTLIVLGTDRGSGAADIKKSTDLSLKLAKGENEATVDSKIFSDEDIAEGAGSIDLVVGRGQTPETGGEEIETKSPVSKINGVPLTIGKEIKKDRKSSKSTEGNPDLISDKSRVLISQKTKIDTKLKIKKNKELFQISDDENGDASILAKSDKVRVVARKDSQIIVGNESGDEIVTICGKDDGNLFLHSKNTSIKIDPDGNITLEAKKDIILKPSASGFIKLGGEDANLAVLCGKNIGVSGSAVSSPLFNGAGGINGSGGPDGQFATKVLMK
jgi:hypothetical protein